MTTRMDKQSVERMLNECGFHTVEDDAGDNISWSFTILPPGGAPQRLAVFESINPAETVIVQIIGALDSTQRQAILAFEEYAANAFYEELGQLFKQSRAGCAGFSRENIARTDEWGGLLSIINVHIPASEFNAESLADAVTAVLQTFVLSKELVRRRLGHDPPVRPASIQERPILQSTPRVQQEKTKTRKKIGPRSFCGEVREVTADHVPPRSFFPPGELPYQLVTVDACKRCNSGFGADDEYFQAAAVSDSRASGNATARSLIPKVNRAILRHKASGPTGPLLTTARVIPVWTPDGASTMGSYFPDGKKLSRSIARQARGLYFYELNRRVPDNFGAFAIPLSVMNALDMAYWGKTIAWIRAGRERVFGDAFRYCMRFVEDNESAGEVMFAFAHYEYFTSFCLIESRTKLGERDFVF